MVMIMDKNNITDNVKRAFFTMYKNTHTIKRYDVLWKYYYCIHINPCACIKPKIPTLSEAICLLSLVTEMCGGRLIFKYEYGIGGTIFPEGRGAPKDISPHAFTNPHDDFLLTILDCIDHIVEAYKAKFVHL